MKTTILYIVAAKQEIKQNSLMHAKMEKSWRCAQYKGTYLIMQQLVLHMRKKEQGWVIKPQSGQALLGLHALFSQCWS
jgi:hypothetical protein